MPRIKHTSPLHSRDFRFLASGVAIDSFGIAMAPIALAFAVLDLGGSTTQLGLVVAAFAAAQVVTMLFGGVLGDRLPRQLLMQGSAALAAAIQAVCATVLITGHGEIWLLTVLGVVDGCLGALAQPSSQAMTRLTVRDDQLPDAVAIRRLGQQVAQVAGFAAGGAIVAWFGPGWAIAVDAATYAVAAGCFSFIRASSPARAEERPSLLGELTDGAREVFRHAWLWILIGQALLYHLFYGGVQGVLGPVVVRREWDEAAWGVALAALMGGFILGGLVALRWRPTYGLRAGVALLSLTAAFPLAMATTDSLLVLLLGAAVHGFGLELFSVNWDLSIQQNVPEDKLARVYSFDSVGSFVCRPLGLALTGPVAAITGEHGWLIIVAAVMGLSSVASLAVPSVRALRRKTPAVSSAPR